MRIFCLKTLLMSPLRSRINVSLVLVFLILFHCTLEFNLKLDSFCSVLKPCSPLSPLSFPQVSQGPLAMVRWDPRAPSASRVYPESRDLRARLAQRDGTAAVTQETAWAIRWNTTSRARPSRAPGRWMETRDWSSANNRRHENKDFDLEFVKTQG